MLGLHIASLLRNARSPASTGVFAAIALLVISMMTPAAAAVGLDKSTCLTAPAINAALATPCSGSVQTGMGTIVWYKIIADNASNSAANVTLRDNYPNAFHALSVTCKLYDVGYPTVAFIGLVQLLPSLDVNFSMPAQKKVVCFIAGYFDAATSWQNFATDFVSGASSSTANVDVDGSKLDTDLSITKTCTPNSINVTGSAQVVTCTVIVENQGPHDVAL
ncbi:MAG: hypothetical protein ABL888_02915 [Pirellulaceae bacterium]